MKKGDKAYWLTEGQVLPVILCEDYHEDAITSVRLPSDHQSARRTLFSSELWPTEKDAVKRGIEFYSRQVRLLEAQMTHIMEDE